MKKSVSNVELNEMTNDYNPNAPVGSTVLSKDFDLIKDVEVPLNVFVGEGKIPVGELFSLTKGSVISLDTLIHEPISVFVKDKLIAKGHLVAVDDSYGVEIKEIID